MKIVRPLATAAAALGLVATVLPAGPAAAAPDAGPSVSSALVFLRGQQQTDGGFETAGATGFETTDAVFALAVAGQDGVTWDTVKARNAVETVKRGGLDGLDYLDHWMDGVTNPTDPAAMAAAAKVIALAATPLGIDPRDFDPSADTAGKVDLVARMNGARQADGSYDMGTYFNGVLFAAIALHSIGETVPAGLITQIERGQRGNGSWDYTGQTGPDGDDVDTTAMALLALQRAGRTTADPVVASGLGFLARRQQASGAWQAFGADDPNSTSSALLALGAYRIDPTTAAWVKAFAPERSVTSYRSPIAYLGGQQAADGHIKNASEGDYGVNTFATSQTIQAVSRQWFQDGAHEDLVVAMAHALGSPVDAPSGAAAPIATDALGGNVAIASARVRAARAVLDSTFGREAAAADLFERVFARDIDTSGRSYWGKKLITITRPEMLARLTGSNEFFRLSGGTTASFVDHAYQVSLGRLPDIVGKTYWEAAIDRGAPRESIARSLVTSREARGREVDLAYQVLFDRAPDAAGRTYWTNALLKTRIEVLLAGMAGSQEFLARATS